MDDETTPRTADEDENDLPGSTSMTDGLDREYASMGTGEAGGGVGGGGASSSDVEWRDEDEEASLRREETAGGAMTNEQEFLEDET